MGEAAFAHLTVAGDGTASGRFLRDDLYFMSARPHLPPPRPLLMSGIGQMRGARVDPAILQAGTALWMAQLAVPQAQISWGVDTTFLVDAGTGAHADVVSDSGGGWIVHQHGPINLWDRVEEAILTWHKAGRPHQSGFGLSVGPEEQRVWLGDPEGPSWNLPA